MSLLLLLLVVATVFSIVEAVQTKSIWAIGATICLVVALVLSFT